MDSTLSSLLKKGFVYISDDQIESAIQTFKEALVIDPGNDLAWGALYESYKSMNNIPEAYHVLEQIYALKPTNFQVLLNLALFYKTVQKDQKKEDYYLGLLEKNHPNDARTYMYIGQCNITRDHDKAMTYLQRAIEVDETFIPAYTSLAGQYEEAGDYQKAYAILEQGYEKGVPGVGRSSKYALKDFMDELKKEMKEALL
ncbi:tetratricopeptide repeat protein [Segatella bryantii]|jgi:Tfp pilus assembly protein PilF|uniref:tetratricopeptide repeat protein n=1 Tax=Segatella bryantii TaxID=77095 RepID=UPI00242CA8BD|nr:tetratricopeptide repeat protein [Segatella bryantii]